MKTYTITLVNIFNQEETLTQTVEAYKPSEGLDIIKAPLQNPEEWLVSGVELM